MGDSGDYCRDWAVMSSLPLPRPGAGQRPGAGLPAVAGRARLPRGHVDSPGQCASQCASLHRHLLHLHSQFIGHGVFEGRAPALLDSWDQAFITAPLFVILEILFFLGYRKQFHQDCMQEVEVELQKFRANKAK